MADVSSDYQGHLTELKRRSMRILHIYKDYPPVHGGIENHVRTLAEAQAACGHDVTVLVCSQGLRSRVECREGVSIIRSGRLAKIRSMPISLAQVVSVSRLDRDITHVHSPFPWGELANWVFGQARATVHTHHSDIVRQRIGRFFYGPVLRRVLRTVDAIITTSPRYEETSIWLEGVRDRCHVVPLGIDLKRFTPGRSRVDGLPTLLFVGRLRYYKGVGTLLHAMTRVPQLALRIVGDGPMRSSWQRLAADLDLGPRVSFVGEVSDEKLPDYYRSSDVLILPSTSRAEAFGIVLLEAMATGLPVISTELGTGTSWVNEDGVSGLVVPPGDASALSRAITDLLSDDDARLKMGRAARARVEANFSSDTMVERIEEVYRQALV